MNSPLRVAVPNKGALSDGASQMLIEAGYIGRSDARALTATDIRNGVEFFFLRPRDIAIYVGSGDLDLGITGRDLLLDSDQSNGIAAFGLWIVELQICWPKKFFC